MMRDIAAYLCWQAERALTAERDMGREPDPRSWRAVAAKRGWLAGEVSDAELRASKSAAWDAWKENKSGAAKLAAYVATDTRRKDGVMKKIILIPRGCARVVSARMPKYMVVTAGTRCSEPCSEPFETRGEAEEVEARLQQENPTTVYEVVEC